MGTQIHKITKEMAKSNADVVVDVSRGTAFGKDESWYAMPLNNRCTVWKSRRDDAIMAAERLAELSGGKVLVRA